MANTKQPLPQLNRAIGVLLCGLMLLCAIYNVATPQARANLNIVKSLLLLIFSGLAFYGMWFSLTYRSCLADDPKRLAPLRHLDVLQAQAGENQADLASDDSYLGFVWVAGAILGILVGWLVTPADARDNLLGVCVLSGAILGVVGSHLLVRVLKRKLNINFAPMIGYGFMGAMAALSVGMAIMPFVDWSLPVLATIVLMGSVVGVFFGRSQPVTRR